MLKEEAVDIVKKIVAWFPSWRVDKEVIKVWVETLEPLDHEYVKKNLEDYMKQGSEFPPSMSVLMRRETVRPPLDMVDPDEERKLAWYKETYGDEDSKPW